jgi:D-alanyl-D-alanine carboxypeptidase (penicillin-binding protein 5/6)
MHRIALSLLTLLTLAGAGASAAAVQTKAHYALLIDSSSGKVLLQKNADAPMAPASTTKILTAEVVFSELASGRLKLDDTFLVSAHAASEGDAESGGSSMFAEAGSRARVEDLLRGLLVASGNDAAIALAEGIAGTETAFAGLMNAHARAIRMTRSHFANPWGGPGNRVTAYDMAHLASYVIATYPQYYRYFGESEFTWNGVRQQNRNPLLQVGADGLKTGHLAASGYGLVGSGAHAGHRLILVLNGLKSEKERASEGRRLLEWGFQEAR